MLKKFEIHGIHNVIDKKLHKYVTKKIGSLDRYMSPKYQESAHIKVHLSESKVKDNNHCAVTATMHLPKQEIVIKEKALNMYAAIDIVELKLRQQLQRYKEKHGTGNTRRHLFAKFSRQSAISQPLETS